mmetsp:Transcript_23437/g.31086  ORF Transcript_23437/g.31086 Transcript_23437/m.31086 type:complete len:214 (+) Transcript_23437:870-1511(+)
MIEHVCHGRDASISRPIICGEGARKHNIVGKSKQAVIGFGVWREVLKGLQCFFEGGALISLGLTKAPNVGRKTGHAEGVHGHSRVPLARQRVEPGKVGRVHALLVLHEHFEEQVELRNEMLHSFFVLHNSHRSIGVPVKLGSDVGSRQYHSSGDVQHLLSFCSAFRSCAVPIFLSVYFCLGQIEPVPHFHATAECPLLKRPHISFCALLQLDK